MRNTAIDFGLDTPNSNVVSEGRLLGLRDFGLDNPNSNMVSEGRLLAVPRPNSHTGSTSPDINSLHVMRILPSCARQRSFGNFFMTLVAKEKPNYVSFMAWENKLQKLC